MPGTPQQTASTLSVDVLGSFAGLPAGSAVDRLRDARPAARENAQLTYDYLFDPIDDSAFSRLERYAVAAFVAGLHESPTAAAHYRAGLADAGASGELAAAVQAQVDAGRAEGPYGTYREPGLAAESVDGLELRIGEADRDLLGARLSAALEHAHLLALRPREASPERLEALVTAGWTATGIVTLSQLVAFLAYQLRAAAGLAVLHASTPDQGKENAEVPVAAVGTSPRPEVPEGAHGAQDPGETTVHRYPDLVRPERFTRRPLGWVPWLEPVAQDALTDRQREGLIEPSRASFAYFRLLARDPEVLGARTRLDNDVFYNTDGGLPRPERELAAAAASRLNGCVFCASVHARAAAQLSERPDDVDRLLEEGVGTSIDERWDAIIAAAVALTRTPVAFDDRHVQRLRSAGLGIDEIADVIHCASFFNWANRLMLSIGEPQVPTR